VNAVSSPHPYRHFWWQTLLRLLLSYLAPLVLLAIYFNVQYRDLLRESQRAHLRSVAESQAATLDLFLRERVVNLVNQIEDPRLPLPPTATSIAEHLAKLQKDSDAFVDLGYFDSTGVLRTYAGPYPSLVGRSYGEEPWFKALETSAKPFVVTDLYLGFRQRPHFTIAVRRSTEQGPVILRATLDPERFLEYAASLRGSSEVISLVVNPSGTFQLVHVPSTGATHQRAIVPPRNPRAGVGRWEDAEGTMEYAYSWLDITNWALIVLPAGPQAAAAGLGLNRSLIAITVAAILAVLSTIVVRTTIVVRSKKAEDRAKAQLSDQLLHASRLASVGELAAGVAHEINNPLAVIAEEAGLMRDMMDPSFGLRSTPEELVPHLASIHEAVFRARDITRKLLSFVRRTEANPQPNDVNEILEDVVASLFARESAVSNIEIVRELAPSLPRVFVDRGQLEQVIVNLLTNAIDAIDRAGRITITTRAEGREVHVAVSDTGVGIPPENLERIFMPFFTTKEVGKGTGLGLSVSYGIVKNMGGTILVESAPGEGSTFTVVLPAMEEETA
jgi:two-component system NtrC family sensor kinase